jgi:quinohemoprotein ethanol dehydrogenase
VAAKAAAKAAAKVVDWPGVSGNSDETRFSPLNRITVKNIDKLGLAWSLDLPGERSLEATPLEVNGVLYFSGSYAGVYAVDAASGKLLWQYDPKTWQVKPSAMGFGLPVNRGVAYDDGRIFVGAVDGRLIALDAKTGKVAWCVDTIPAKMLNVITGAPRVFHGKVIIGNSGAEFGSRGFVTAYDGKTGKQLWRFFTVPGSPDANKGDPVMERAAATWSGKYWLSGTGGVVWDSITYDKDLNQIYIGTANPGPFDPAIRSPGNGDNLYTASIVALNADTGKYVWHYQLNPRDAWDYDATQQMTLATLSIAGKPHKVLMQAPKNGFFYVLDRKTGKLISAEKFAKVTWADHIDLATGRPVELPKIRYVSGDTTAIWPGTLGAHSWQGMSFSPKTGLVYIPAMQIGAHFIKGKPSTDGISFAGLTIGFTKADDDDGKATLLAWDPVHQKAAWQVKLDSLWNGGTLATSGNLVFQGTADGYLSAYDAITGQRVWHYNAGLGIIAAPMSYSLGGKQYISLLVGYGGTAGVASQYTHMGWKFNAQPRRLLTFALDGKATLPPAPGPDMVVHAVDDPSIKIDPAQAAMGRGLYTTICSACHGFGLQSVGAPGPDLRESQIALRMDSFLNVVHDGALMSEGMPRFNLPPMIVQAMYAYIRASARDVVTAQGQH